ncbi:MAG TPA: 23S rRNA (guanosine(2251)-2'-O)-methyltransferase RlmB [Bacteroidales bacterium]|nr:23S rRNA (guanosine(2251)-2'-O)-methyltransferase RlmB [Bacteroidales bacterium]
MENIIFGIRPLLEALQSGERPEKILLQQGLHGENFQDLFQIIRNEKVPFQMVPPEKLNRITKKNHQGVIAYISGFSYTTLHQVLPKIYEQGEMPLLMIVDRVTDVRNLGAIARSAECFGAHALVLPEKGSAPVNADAIKTSAGALSKLPVCREPNLLEAIAFLKESGVLVVAATEKASKPLNNVLLSGPVAFVMGSEDKGLSKAILTMADETAFIPVNGTISSLNVSVAAGIFLYEARRQRKSKHQHRK